VSYGAVIERVKEDDYENLTLDAALSRAKEKGLSIRVPADNELFLDFDNAQQWNEFIQNRFPALNRILPGCKYVSTPSVSRGVHRHVVVTLPRTVKSEYERLAMQGALGSDPMRELLSWARIEKGASKYPTLFFEKP
jgi:hypothetical protein